MKTKSIKQIATFKASPHDVYETLMDSRKHSKFTSDKATISRKIGGKFSTFGGYAQGTNINLIPDTKIVQSWRANDWTEGHYSEVTFLLDKVEGGTRLTFTQTGVPEEQYNDISQGWRDYYWKPMKDLLAKK